MKAFNRDMNSPNTAALMEFVSKEGIAPLLGTAIKVIKQLGDQVPIMHIMSLCIAQGYLNGCLDVMNSETATENDKYLLKLRSLLIPVRIELETMQRDIESKTAEGESDGS